MALPVKLHNVAAAITSEAQLDSALKPSTRNLPSFVFGVPDGLPSLIVTYPLFVVRGKGNLHQKWRWPLPSENDRHLTLPPQVAKVRRIGHWKNERFKVFFREI